MIPRWRGAQDLAIALAVLASSAVGCSSFVQTDKRFQVHERHGYPKVFVDHLPEFEYRSVGVIEVHGRELRDIMSQARRKGHDVGCDLVVDMRIHKISLGVPGMGPLLAYGYNDSSFGSSPAPPAPSGNGWWFVEPGPISRFICGVWLKDGENDDPDDAP